MKKIYVLCFLSIFCFGETVDCNKKVEEKAINGDLESQISCSNYYRGSLVEEPNSKKGLMYLEMAAKQDNVSKYHLANYYLNSYLSSQNIQNKKNGCSLLIELYNDNYNIDIYHFKENCKDYIK